MKLAIVTSHPIQYNAPFFRKLAQLLDLELKVFYTWSQSEKAVHDPGFGQTRSWDIPLLEGYHFTFVDNKAKKPGSHHFWGIYNPSLNTEVELFQPDAILVYGWSFYSHLKLMHYFKGKIPLWFRGDSNLLDEPAGFSWKKHLRRLALKWVYSHVDKAFYVGQANRDYYLKHGLKPKQLVFAPHAIDNQRFAENSAGTELEAQKWRTQLGIPSESVVFLFVGKFEPKKNPLGLIRAFQAFTHHAYLILVGDGAEKERIQELAKNDPKIILLGFQNQSIMPVVYRLANVLVLPSKGPNETWGLVVNEAFASGRAAIVSNVVGCAIDLIEAGNSGWVFSSDDLRSFTDKLKKAIEIGSAGLDQMGELAQALIQGWNYEAFSQVLQSELHK
jgi:glycosyltransferase involved in cell wall biosynthesis